MNVVGFDVSKASLAGARIDRSGKVREHFELVNTVEALTPLLTDLQQHYTHLLVGAESTGDYHRPLAEVCLGLDIPFRLLNPITSKRYVRSTIRKRKTDRSDAEAIARVALQGEGTLVTSALLQPAKPILRASLRLNHHAQALTLIEQHLTALSLERPELLQTVAQCQTQLLAACTLFRQVATTSCDPAVLRLLLSIPGIGNKVAPVIALEIGDITRFTNPRQLVAYAGLDPRVMQSGTSLNRYGHLTKRGSPPLRQALFLAATIARRYDPSMQAVYDKKRAEGKRYREAVVVVARKLIRVIYAVWTTNKPYQLRLPQ
jgi:transposase